MIAQSQLQEFIQAWTPPEFETPVEDAWRAWAHCEMAKRCVSLFRFEIKFGFNTIFL
jgi:hypothetical protein